MRKWIVGLLILSITACAPKGPDPVTAPDGTEISSPVDYNNYFIALQQQVITKMGTFSESLESFDTSSIRQEHKALIQTIESTIEKAEQTPAYGDDDVLKPAFLDLFRFYQQLSTEEYGTIVNLIEGGESSISDDDLRVIDSLTKSIELQQTKVKASFNKAQNRFAEQYQLEVEKTKANQ